MKLLRLKKWNDFGLEISLEILSWKRFNVCTCAYSCSDLHKATKFLPEISVSFSFLRWHSLISTYFICNKHAFEVTFFEKTFTNYTSQLPTLLEF